MCGIAGILNFGPPVSNNELVAFTDALTHRGPDASGYYIDGDIGLGHRRLSILDLSDAGKCPMLYLAPDGEALWIVFNGEVFNFLELRNELISFGYTFRTQTDTEVIAAAYHKWGSNCLVRFNGMFALAIWMPSSRSLFLARDRFGVKPLYFSVNSRFTFASELKAFTKLKGFNIQINDALLPELINGNTAEGASQESVMKGVLKLLPGHSLLVSRDGQVSIKKWWDTSAHIPTIPTSYSEQVDEFRSLFLDAVRIRMRSDVAIGTCLSGGIDSSAVACAMNYIAKQGMGGERFQSDWQRTCVATFPGTMVDEKQFADIVINHVGAKPHYWEFRDEEVLPHVLESVWASEEIVHALTVPVWCTYRELRKHGVVVSLDGHGGDELLGGYSGYLDWPYATFNQGLYSDLHSNLLPAILRNFDRCSSAHGVEVRTPILDWRLVTYSFALPTEAKVGEGFTKRILRDAMRDIMPERIRTRRSKIGFNSPMIEWFNGGLQPLMRAVVNHPLWLDSKCFDGPKLRELIMAKCDARAWTKDDWGLSLRIWVFMTVVIWQLLFVEGKKPTFGEMFPS